MQLEFHVVSITAEPEGGVRMMSNKVKNTNAEKLVDISTIQVDQSLSYEERVKSYLSQIGNPYRYLDHGFTVTCSFAGERTVEDCLTSYLCEKYGVQKA